MTFRCSAASRDRDEPVAGSASTVRAFLLVENAGPWGVDALRDAPAARGGQGRSAGPVGHRPGAHPADPAAPGRQPHRQPGRRGAAGLRGVRRPGRAVAGDDHPVRPGAAARPGPGGPRPRAVTRARPPARSRCCASARTAGTTPAAPSSAGPLATALAAALPEHTWEVSHIGGDRFAANVLVLPDGLYYGRVSAADAPRLAATHLDGRLDLDLLRGRSGFGFAVQVAEVALRREVGETRTDAVRLVSTARVRRRHHRADDGRGRDVRRGGPPDRGRAAAPADLPGDPGRAGAELRDPGPATPVTGARPGVTMDA